MCSKNQSPCYLVLYENKIILNPSNIWKIIQILENFKYKYKVYLIILGSYGMFNVVEDNVIEKVVNNRNENVHFFLSNK